MIKERIFGITITAVDTIKMTEEDVRLELEIYDEDYIPTEADWEEAIEKRVNFYAENEYFLKEREATIAEVNYEEI